MITNENMHLLLASRINEMMRHYNDLPPETKQEIIRFFQTPERITRLRLNPFRRRKPKKDKTLYVLI
jgi:hypothetical protein